MTPKERTNPEILNGSRRNRIAKGSGTDIQEVNRLIKQFDQTRKMMKMITGGNMAKMMGKMPKMPNFKRQVGIFDIDGVNFQYINKISLFCYDFPNQDETKPDDIFIKDFEICGSQALSAVDLESCSLSFITPQGVYFDENDLPSATRTLMAQVRVKGKYINPDSQKLPYYWFVENNGVTSLSEDFNAYGGQG
jgi:hypothetical protein